MKPSFVFFVATLAFLVGTTAAQEPAASKNVIDELRAEIQRVEAELARQSARLNELNARLAKIGSRQPAASDSRQPAANRLVPPPPLRFSIGIERDMMGEAVSHPGIKLERENELFDDNELRPRRPGPTIPPRK